METGKSDETRKVGEEVVGPIDLPRPEGAGPVMMVVLLGVTTIGASVIAESFETFFAPWFALSEEAHSFKELCQAMIYLMCFFGLHWWHNRSNPRFHILKNDREFSASPAGHIEIWSEDTALERAIRLVAGVLLTVYFSWLIFTNSNWVKQLLGVFVVMILAAMIWNSFRQLLRPLLVFDIQGATILGRHVPWKRVQNVEVEHRRDFTSSFAAVKISFLDARRRKVAHISLPKSQCGRAKEEELLAFIAARLGRSYEPLAQPEINWQ